MKVLYEGVDITKDVDVLACRHWAHCGDRADSIEMVLDHTETWYGWKPEPDDRIEITMNGYTTGEMYLNAIIPYESGFRITATSMPVAARRKAWASYENKSLSAIMAACAGECGMKSAQYGINGGMVYPYVVRENESGAAFLNRLLKMEGAVLKCFDGEMQAIGIEYAQGQAAVQKIELAADEAGSEYVRRDDKKLARITIQTVNGAGSAQDSAAADGQKMIASGLAARDSGQAGRWARGALLTNNRLAEQLVVSSEFNAGFEPMARIDIESRTDTAGKWLVHEVEHDFVENASRAVLVRCVTTIG